MKSQQKLEAYLKYVQNSSNMRSLCKEDICFRFRGHMLTVDSEAIYLDSEAICLGSEVLCLDSEAICLDSEAICLL